MKNFEYAEFYYDKILAALQRARRRLLKELTDFSEYAPESQMEGAMAAVAHQMNTNLDILANELFTPSARLLQSLINRGNELGYPFRQNTPSAVDLVGRLLADYATQTTVVSVGTKFQANVTGQATSVPFETMEDFILYDTTLALQYYYCSNLNAYSATVPVDVLRAGDCVCFGCEVMVSEWVFALTTAQVGLTGIWEYYDGMTGLWEPLTIQEDGTVVTAALQQAGTLKFRLPQGLNSDWSIFELNTVPAYWIRWRVTAVETTANWPDVSIDDMQSKYVKFQATEGLSTEETLTSSGFANQYFNLAQVGLVESTLDHIYVNETGSEDTWDKVDSFASAGPMDTVFRYIVDAAGRITLLLGDGSNGYIPRPGVDIRVPYRVLPLTVSGNIPALSIANASAAGNVGGVQNPRPATGYKAAFEDKEVLRQQIPAWVKANERAVSPPDLEYFLLNDALGGGSSPIARVSLVDEGLGRNTVAAYVVGTEGAYLSSNDKEAIQDRFNNKVTGILLTNKQLGVFNYTRRVLSVVATVWGGDRVQVTEALIAALNPLSTRLDKYGNTVYRWGYTKGGATRVTLTYLISIIQDCDGVERVLLVTPSAEVVLGPSELPWLLESEVALTMKPRTGA